MPSPRPARARYLFSKFLLVSQIDKIDMSAGVTPLIRVGGSRAREVALTFDDGPSIYTPRILRVLAKWHVPAATLQLELTPKLKYINLGVNTLIWQDFFMGADLVFRPEATAVK